MVQFCSILKKKKEKLSVLELQQLISQIIKSDQRISEISKKFADNLCNDSFSKLAKKLDDTNHLLSEIEDNYYKNFGYLIDSECQTYDKLTN